MARDKVNDGQREMMAVIKRDWNRSHATVTSTGTQPAFVLTYTTAPASLVTGMLFAAKMHAAPTGSVTLSVDGGSTFKKCYDSAGSAQLGSGAWAINSRCVWSYDSTLDSSAGGFIWVNQDKPLAAGSGIGVSGMTISLDINGLTEDTTPDAAADFVATYDNSATANKKVKLSNLAGIPIGTIADYAGTSAPTNWLLCYGQNVSRTTYASLFSAISTTFGSGDGSTTFGLPDLRGRTTFGKDDMGGSAANRVTNAVSGITGTTLGSAGGSQSLTAHTHTYDKNSGTGISPGASGQGGSLATIASGSTGSGSSENMPPAVIMNKIIYAGA